MLKEKHICTVYVVLWGFYSIQSLFGMTGSSLTQVLVILLNAISFAYCIMSHLSGKIPFYIKALDLFLTMITVYGVAYMFTDGVALYAEEQIGTFNYIKNIYNSLLPIYFFFYYSRKGVLTEEYMTSLAVYFLIVAYLEYISNDVQMRRELESNGAEFDGFVNNMGYVFLSLIPVLSFLEKKVLFQYAMLLYVVVFVFLGMKRGAILICLFCLFFFLWKSIRNSSKSQKGFMLLLTVFVLMCTILWVKYLLENSVYFNIRLVDTLDGNSSGRDYLYAACVEHIFHRTSDWEFLFGSGAMSTLEVTRSNVAHNDWLELAVNQGVLGVVVYVVYWIGFILFWRSVRNDPKLYFIVGLLLFIYFTKTLFSMSYGGMNVYSTSVLGYCLGTSCRSQSWERI